MLEDDIVSRARQTVRARRIAEVEQQWGGSWRWILPSLVCSALIAFLIAPGAVPQKLLWAMGGVCNLRPTHSYFAGTVQLPLESRMMGIYGGFMVTFMLLLALRRMGARRLGHRRTLALLTLMFGSMVFDGVNSTLTDYKLFHLYTSTNATRLATGLLSGIALAPVLLWLLNAVVLEATPSRGRAVIRAPWELAILIGANAVFAAFVLMEQSWLFYPLALIGAGGIVAMLWSAALLIIAASTNLAGRVTRPQQLIAPGALALLVALVILIGTAALRWSTVGPLT